MIRYEPMQVDDIPACAEIVAAHPVLAPRYGSSIELLQPAWRKLLGSEAFLTVAIQQTAPEHPKMLGIQIACFITDEFAAAIATRPLKWIGPALVNRVLQGPSPILTDADVRLANSTGGLNLTVWPTCFSPEYETNAEIRQTCQRAFFDFSRGFNVKRLQTQVTHPMELCIAVNSGARYLLDGNPNHSQDLSDAERVTLQPHILEVTPAMASREPGTWADQFFSYRKPKIGFPRSEQRLLSVALQGGTDEELAEKLGVSLSAVKKMWASVYLRTESRSLSDLKLARNDNADGDRGRAKKHKLLVYLREHPEELRPYSMKLLNRTATEGSHTVAHAH